MVITSESSITAIFDEETVGYPVGSDADIASWSELSCGDTANFCGDTGGYWTL